MATGILRRLAEASPAPAAPSVAGHPSIHDVYQAHFRYVWRCLRGLGVGEHALEDAAHDVFLVVQRKLPSFDGAHAQVTTWLYEIALRVARRYRTQAAKDARRRDASAAAEEEDACGDPFELPSATEALIPASPPCELEQGERLALARRALDALDPDKREAFVLSCVEQRSAPEIARIAGVPLNTVYSRIRAARRLFAAHVARLESANGRSAR